MRLVDTLNDLACNDDDSIAIAIAIVALHCKQALLTVENDFVCTHFREFDSNIENSFEIDRMLGQSSHLSSFVDNADLEMTNLHNPVRNKKKLF